jgi:hypothetical protein
MVLASLACTIALAPGPVPVFPPRRFPLPKDGSRRIAVPGRSHLLAPQSLLTIGATKERKNSRKTHLGKGEWPP